MLLFLQTSLIGPFLNLIFTQEGGSPQAISLGQVLSKKQTFKSREFQRMIITINKMEIEEAQAQMEEEQIMIMLDGLEAEDDPDLLDLLGSQPQCFKKGSLNYDYQPAPPSEQLDEASELKTSNRSTSTCADSDPPLLRKCTCMKTRCLKNYCECFKLGETCSAECECRDCGNREKLFSRPVAIKIKCKCLKSHCLKKYCECHNSGLKCGPECKCLECENGQEVAGGPEAMETEGGIPGNYFDHHLFFDI